MVWCPPTVCLAELKADLEPPTLGVDPTLGDGGDDDGGGHHDADDGGADDGDGGADDVELQLQLFIVGV